MNATRPHWWVVNIGSDNDLVSSGDKPFPGPMLTKIYDELWFYFATGKGLVQSSNKPVLEPMLTKFYDAI